MKRLFVLSVLPILLTVPYFGLGQETGGFANIPSSYFDRPLVIDGYDNDWKVGQEVIPKNFTGILSQISNDQNNLLRGQVLAMNNDTHLALYIKMITLYPVKNPYRQVYLSFDENGDGKLSGGDNALVVTSEGSTHRPISDLYITDKGTIDYDPPEDTKIFEAFLRYFSNSEIAIEILVPFNDTNDFYDLRFLNPLQFNMILTYGAGPAGIADSSAFGAFFTYLIAMNPNITLVPGILILSIFALSVIISIAVVIIYIRKKISPKPAFLRSSKLGIIVLSALAASVAVVFLNPLVIEDITSSLRQLSASVNHNFPLSIIYVCILGVLPALFSLSLFTRSEEFISRAFFGEGFLIRGPIALLLIQLILFGAAPVIISIMGIPAIGGGSDVVENIRPQVSLLQDIMGLGINQIVILGLFYCFLIWIPTAFMIFTMYEIPSSQMKSTAKIAFIATSLILFFITAIWSIFGLFISSPVDIQYIFLLIGPTIAAVLFSFIAAQGYIDTLKASLKKIRWNQPFTQVYPDKSVPENIFTMFRKITNNLGAIFVLIITVIGLSKNLFLLTIPFVSFSFPLGLSPINEIFINSVSDYAIHINSGQNFAAASTIYNSFAVFFSLFWLYDIIMVLRGLGKEFLNSESVLYKSLRTHIGLLTSLCFLSIVILFTTNGYLSDFRIDQINSEMPIWVRQLIGIQGGEIQLLSDLSSQFSLFTGISTLLGVVYVLVRSRSPFKGWLISILKID